MNKGGDTLASGGIRAQFPPAGGGKTQKEWDEMWKDYAPAKTFEKPKRKKKKN
jgi:hypothetical protein